MNAFDAVREQIEATLLEAREVLHLRITNNALPGSVVALPLSPERARTLVADWVAAQPLGDDLHARARADAERLDRYVELLVHPDDYIDLLRVPGSVFVNVHSGAQSVLGYPVRMEAA